MLDNVSAGPSRLSNPHAIARIGVERLFGQFTYQLPAKAERQQDLSNLFILYGDNGSGKTTILKLLFYLLSPEPGKGYKSEVAKVRFKRFAVELGDGTTIEALCTGKSLEGSYRTAILKGSETVDAMDFPVDPGGRLNIDEVEKSASKRISQAIGAARDSFSLSFRRPAHSGPEHGRGGYRKEAIENTYRARGYLF